MPEDNYRRWDRATQREWEIVMMATKYMFNRYRQHRIEITTNEELRIEASRSEKYRNKAKETA